MGLLRRVVYRLTRPWPMLLSGSGVVMMGAVVWRSYRMQRSEYRPKKLEDQTFIVTGATSGIGLETAKELSMAGAKVIIPYKDGEKCMEVRRSLVKSLNRKMVVCRKCDMSDPSSIHKFALRMIDEENNLKGLINNAAVCGYSKKHLAPNGIEKQMQVNYFGPYLLSLLLLDKLADSKGRIVNVTCLQNNNAQLDLDDVNMDKGYEGMQAYYKSKVAIAYFSQELAKRLQGTGVVSHLVDPGFCNTDIDRFRPYRKYYSSRTWTYVASLFTQKSPARGCAPVLFAATSKKVEPFNGLFLTEPQLPESTTPVLTDPTTQVSLWNLSKKWTNAEDYLKKLPQDLEMKRKKKLEDDQVNVIGKGSTKTTWKPQPSINPLASSAVI